MAIYGALIVVLAATIVSFAVVDYFAGIVWSAVVTVATAGNWHKFDGGFRSGRRDGAALSHFDILLGTLGDQVVLVQLKLLLGGFVAAAALSLELLAGWCLGRSLAPRVCDPALLRESRRRSRL